MGELQFLRLHRLWGVATSCARSDRSTALLGHLLRGLATPSPRGRAPACADRLELRRDCETVPVADPHVTDSQGNVPGGHKDPPASAATWAPGRLFADRHHGCPRSSRSAPVTAST